MPKFDELQNSIAKYRRAHGRNADSTIRAKKTGDREIDTASDEMIERILAAGTTTRQNPKSMAELDTAAIWRKYNSAGKNAPGAK